jgi:hypothetical protein
VYTVVFTKKALDEVTTLWLNANSPLRAAITAAMASLEESLGRDPASAGESREHGVRIGFAPPLAFLFEILQDDRQVKVFHVWLWPSN